jgi:hypothetical protein
MRELTDVLQVEQPVALGVVDELCPALDQPDTGAHEQTERDGRCPSRSCQDLIGTYAEPVTGPALSTAAQGRDLA